MNSRFEQSSLSEKEENLLKRIIDKGVRQLKPSIGPGGVQYSDIDDIIKDLDWDWNTLKVYLESINKKGYFIIKKVHFALFCPICNSADVYSKYECTRCRSSNVNRIRLVEHSFCGYTGVMEEFESGTRLVCPNCKTDLGERKSGPPGDGSKEDYRIIGTSFECEKCGNRFDRPLITHVCQTCGEEYNYRTAIYGKYFEFEIPEQIISQYRKGGRINILLVEDSTDDAIIMIKILKDDDRSFKVDHVNTGTKAIEKIKENLYDIILLDYRLPGMNGIEILERIKSSKIDTPVIMFTGADDRETAVSAMKLGASDYLIKSVELYQKLPSIITQTVKS